MRASAGRGTENARLCGKYSAHRILPPKQRTTILGCLWLPCRCLGGREQKHRSRLPGPPGRPAGFENAWTLAGAEDEQPLELPNRGKVLLAARDMGGPNSAKSQRLSE